MTEDWRTRNGGRLTPCILLSVVHLDIPDRVVLGPATDKVHVAIAIHTNHGVVHRHRNIGASIPAVINRFVDCYIGNSGLASLPIHHVSAE